MNEAQTGSKPQRHAQVAEVGVERYISDITHDLARMLFDGPSAWSQFMEGPWEAMAALPGLSLPELIDDANDLQSLALAAPKKSPERLWFTNELRRARLAAAAAACVLAERALLDGQERVAWNYAMAAQDMRAVLRTLQVAGGPGGPKLSSAVGRKAATASHREDHAMKGQGLAWFEANKDQFTSLNKAAEAMIKEVPVKVRTAREWLKGKSLQALG